jgi:hypothetical protein
MLVELADIRTRVRTWAWDGHVHDAVTRQQPNIRNQPHSQLASTTCMCQRMTTSTTATPSPRPADAPPSPIPYTASQQHGVVQLSVESIVHVQRTTGDRHCHREMPGRDRNTIKTTASNVHTAARSDVCCSSIIECSLCYCSLQSRRINGCVAIERENSHTGPTGYLKSYWVSLVRYLRLFSTLYPSFGKHNWKIWAFIGLYRTRCVTLILTDCVPCPGPTAAHCGLHGALCGAQSRRLHELASPPLLLTLYCVGCVH